MQGITKLTYEYLRGALEIGGKANIWYGTASLREGAGALERSFHYRLTVEKADAQGENAEEKIAAEWYVGELSYDMTDREDIVKDFFDASEDGAAQAYEWLDDIYNGLKS